MKACLKTSEDYLRVSKQNNSKTAQLNYLTTLLQNNISMRIFIVSLSIASLEGFVFTIKQTIDILDEDYSISKCHPRLTIDKRINTILIEIFKDLK